MELLVSKWFWDILKNADKSRSALYDQLSNFGKEQLIRFYCEWRNAAVELAWCHELYVVLDDEKYLVDADEDGLEFSLWIVSLGYKHFLQALGSSSFSQEYFSDFYNKTGLYLSNEWADDLVETSNSDIEPQYFAVTLYEEKFDDDLEDVCIDMINNGQFDGLIESLRDEEEFLKFEYDSNRAVR